MAWLPQRPARTSPPGTTLMRRGRAGLALRAPPPATVLAPGHAYCTSSTHSHAPAERIPPQTATPLQGRAPAARHQPLCRTPPPAPLTCLHPASRAPLSPFPFLATATHLDVLALDVHHLPRHEPLRARRAPQLDDDLHQPASRGHQQGSPASTSTREHSTQVEHMQEGMHAEQACPAGMGQQVA